MNLTIADGITIFSICAVIITAILRFIPKKIKNPNSNPNSNKKFIDEKFCDERHKSINESLDRIDGNIKRIFELFNNKKK